MAKSRVRAVLLATFTSFHPRDTKETYCYQKTHQLPAIRLLFGRSERAGCTTSHAHKMKITKFSLHRRKKNYVVRF